MTENKKLVDTRNGKLVIDAAMEDENYPVGAMGYLRHLVFLTRKGSLTKAVAKLREDPEHDPAKEKLLQDALEMLYRKYPNESK